MKFYLHTTELDSLRKEKISYLEDKLDEAYAEISELRLKIREEDQ